MDAVQKDLHNRQEEIEAELELLFKTNLKLLIGMFQNLMMKRRQRFCGIC